MSGDGVCRQMLAFGRCPQAPLDRDGQTIRAGFELLDMVLDAIDQEPAGGGGGGDTGRIQLSGCTEYQ